MSTWKCPKCGRTESQPSTVKSVSHKCKPGYPTVDLKRTS